MNLQKYTQKSLEALEKARSEAAEQGHTTLTQAHLMAALLSEKQGLLPELAVRMGVDKNALETGLAGLLAAQPVMHVRRFERETEFALQRPQQMQQRDRIRAAGHRAKHVRALQHAVFADRLERLTSHCAAFPHRRRPGVPRRK